MQLNGKKNVNYFKFKCQALNSNSEGYLSFSILRHRALDPSGHHHRQRCLPAARPVVPGGAGGAMVLADQLTLSQPRGADYAHQIIRAPPDF